MTPKTGATVHYGADLGLPVVDEAAFRNVVGHFASGVTIITTTDDDKQAQLSSPRLEMRKYLGTSYHREVTLRPAK